MTRTTFTALAVTAAVAATGGTASAATLTSTPHGAVDLGDRIAFAVTGAGCERVGVVARLTAGPKGTVVDGPRARPRVRDDDGCAGVATLPDFAALRAAGWQPGDRLDVELVSSAGRVPLRHARMEADFGTPVAGSPDVVAAEDQDTGKNDRAVAMDPGDAISLGRVDLRRADGLALRLCVTGASTDGAPANLGPLLVSDRIEPPVFVSIRQDGPGGPSLIGPIDVASSQPQEFSRLTTLGFGGCYRLVVLPITGRVMEDAPELFLRAEPGGSGLVRVNSVDVTGSGARLPATAPPAPAGMRTIFDGTSFDGWDHTSCALRDGAAVNERGGDDTSIAGCSLIYREPVRDAVMRFRMRREHIVDNAGIYLGAQEIQLRSVGEYLPGGYFGQFAARWQKLSRFPDYDEIEVIALGARHVVTINGRTVTDVMRTGGAPEPTRLQLVSQPEWSYRAGAETSFGNEGYPDISKLGELGAFWFKNVRLLRCSGPDDPVCRRLADARRGQVPVPEGAPAPLPAEPTATRCTTRRRTVVLTLPRAGLRGVRATVGGRRAAARKIASRRVRVTLPARGGARATVRVTARTAAGRVVRVTRVVRTTTACR